MLQSVHMKNLALIDEIEVEFEDGLNILTGETGAGKSIILGSVNLALGGRYTKDIIRDGAQYGLAEITFLVENQEQIKKLQKLEVYPEDGMVVLSRRLKDGRSVSRINGETVQMARLKEVASILIDIHGQHEHQSLLYKKNHMGIVDAFAKEYIAGTKEKVQQAFDTYHALKKELDGADMEDAQREKELVFLNFEVDEIQKAELRLGEDEELEEAYRRMSNGKKIAGGVSEAYEYTSQSGESASESLSRAIRALSESAQYDGRAQELYEQLMEVDGLLNDFNRELSDYEKSCEFSEEELAQTEERLNEINRLKQKYGNRLEDIEAYCKEQELKIEKLSDYEDYVSSLKESLDGAEQKLKKECAQLSKERKEQAAILEQAIFSGLKELHFAEVQFKIHFEELSHYTANGTDNVEFMISLNPGQSVKSLANVASGGELSRIMLAIKTVMAERDDIETLIFDEIDVGISGRTAQKVSEKMALIGRRHQVICITHLAQIAAMADHHYYIEKKAEKDSTKTQIRLLSEEESIQELARILGGAKITDTVVKNAAEMKQLAKETK